MFDDLDHGVDCLICVKSILMKCAICQMVQHNGLQMNLGDGFMKFNRQVSFDSAANCYAVWVFLR